MTEEQPPEATEAPTFEQQMPATAADLDAVDFEAPIRGIEIADAHELYPFYERAFAAAREAKDETAQKVYRLFTQLCSMVMQPSDRGSIWGPLFTLANGTRAPVAEDFRGEQTAALAAVVSRMVSPALRSRIADIAWSNNRRDGASAAAAIDAYCDLVTGLLDGSLKTSHGRIATHEAVPALQRAMQIATATTKRTKRPEKVGQAFEALYAVTQEQLVS